MSSVPVYTGFWHNYSASGAGAWTLTLNVRWSGFLLAALSAFVGIVGASFWSILAFAIHQFRAKPGQEDALYFQQQAIYRNPSSAFGTFIELFNIFWSWRSRRLGTSSQKMIQRSVLFSLPPLVVFVGFTIAAVFVGDVTRPTYESNDVKIKSSNCGMLVTDTGAIRHGIFHRRFEVRQRHNSRAGICKNLLRPKDYILNLWFVCPEELTVH
jgi:hypothetical protein